MHIVVSREGLLEKLQIVGRAVPTRSTIASLSGILIEATSDRLRLTGNDLEISISTEISCDVREPGELVMPAKLFTEAIRRSPADQVVLQSVTDRSAVQLTSGGMQMEILTLPLDEFPEESVFDEKHHCVIFQSLAKNMIRQIDFAISREELRLILTGALWTFGDKELRMTALDGYRLASRFAEVAVEEKMKIIVPAKALRELVRLLSDVGQDLHVSIGSSSVMFEFSGIRLTSRLLEGQFPNTDSFLPKVHLTRLVLKTDQLITSIERAALVSQEGIDGSVKLTIEGDKLTTSAQSMDIGKHHEEISTQKTGDDVQIMYNIRALVELLKSAESDEVEIDFHGSFGPCIVRPVGQKNYIGLLMPVRLN